MNRTAFQANGQVQELSRKGSRELFDRQARRYFNVSGDTFIEKLEAGEYGDPDENPDLMRMVMLLPFAR